ncbi:MAG: DUF1638 domain-containing protein [Hyphomicrobiaceae bacterium]
MANNSKSTEQASAGLLPGDAYEFRRGEGSTLVIACGALAREIVDLIELNRWRHLDVQCLPAIWHNTPERIPGGVRDRIRAAKGRYGRILVAYGDCGTGGELDRVIAEEGVARIEGPHCYAFLAGNAAFAAKAEGEDLTAFFLTDYLARHFDKLIFDYYRLDRPGMAEMMFGNYTKIVYLAQTDDPALDARAREAAARLGLLYERRLTGYGELGTFMAAAGGAMAP